MSTTVKTELSKNNTYWISKYRYYELKHFCLKYFEFKSDYKELSKGYLPSNINSRTPGKAYSDPTMAIAILLSEYENNMKLIRDTCHEADPDLEEYIFKAVTQEYSYNYLKYYEDMPCSRDIFYDRYHKFFWLLNSKLHS